VFVGLLVAVVSLNNLVVKRGEHIVSVVGRRINTDARIKVLAAGKDLLLKVGSEHIFLVEALVPDVAGEVGGDAGLGASGEDGETGDVGGRFRVLANVAVRCAVVLAITKPNLLLQKKKLPCVFNSYILLIPRLY